MSGQCTSDPKSAIVAAGEEAAKDAEAFKLHGETLNITHADRLVGGIVHLSVQGGDEVTEDRFRRTTGILQRVQYVPGSLQAKSRWVSVQASGMVAVLPELASPLNKTLENLSWSHVGLLAGFRA